MLLRSAAWKDLIDVESKKPAHDASIDISTLKRISAASILRMTGRRSASGGRNSTTEDQPKHTAANTGVSGASWGRFANETSDHLAVTSDDLFAASLDFLPGSYKAVDKQAEKRNVHTDEEYCVHDLEATDPLIGTGFKTAHPSEDSFREKEATASVPPLY